MSFLRELVRWNPPQVTRNDGSFQGFVDQLALFQGQLYQPAYTTSIPGEKVETPTDSFLGFVQGIYKTNGIIFAVSMARARLFSEMRFKFRRYGTVGGGNDLFGTQELRPLEVPWPGGTTQTLLMRAEQDVTTAGTFFLARSDDGTRLLRRRPDWMEFVLDAPPDEAVESNIVGYRYTVGGPLSKGLSRIYLPDECVHWAPIPDPDAQYRGMSWLTPIIEEFQSDTLATRHKRKFFENAGTPNMIFVAPPTLTPSQFQDYVRAANEASVGIENAYKNLYLGGGIDPKVVGADFKQIDFRATQGAGETRIAAAGGVPPIIVGLSEGLSSATYSNYGQARRAFADTWASNQWRSICASLAPLIEVPSGAELWYDTRDIPFLRQDVKDLAEVQSMQAATINSLLSAGWTPDSAKQAVLAEDFSLLEHSGLMSVQLQPPVSDTNPNEVATQATTIGGLVAGGWDPESVKEAVLAGDLSQLSPAEEPAPDDEEILAEMEDSLRHLPGKHDQGKHGRRYKIPGDRASGVLKEGKERAVKTQEKTAKPEPRKSESSKPEAKKPEPEKPNKPKTHAEKVDRAEQIARDFMEGVEAGKYVGLEKLRAAMGEEGLTFDEQDEALMRMVRDRDKYNFIEEMNQKTLTSERRVSALEVGNRDKHFVKRYH